MIRVSNTRLPVDNFISGALVGGMSAGLINYNDVKKNNIDTKTAVKKTLKFGLQSGIAAGFAIDASNKFVEKNYTSGLISIVAGLGTIILIDKFVKEK